jgi:hypothetical protein
VRSLLDNQQYQLLQPAYAHLKKDMEMNNQYERVSNALFTEIKEKLQSTSELKDLVRYLIEVLLSDRAEHVSSVGMGSMYKGNFKLFLKDKQTRVKLAQLIRLSKQDEMSLRKIKDIGLIEHLNGFSFVGNKPQAFTHRVFILLFPELNTVTIDRGKLNKIGKKLGISGAADIPFHNIQLQVRDIVNDFVKSEGLQDESTYIKMAISEWIFK